MMTLTYYLYDPITLFLINVYFAGINNSETYNIFTLSWSGAFLVKQVYGQTGYSCSMFDRCCDIKKAK
jgi:hypothetical protein